MAEGSVTNRDEALKALNVARRALAAGDFAKAERFAVKAQSMHPSSEVNMVLLQIKQMQAAEQGASEDTKDYPPAQNGQSSHHQHHHPSSQHSQHETRSKATGIHSANLHQRKAGHHATTQPTEDQGTPEQRKLVSQILAAKDLYEILGLTKSATDDDVRKAYRKLALKLHPDKNKAHKADEAFKAVGKAFACLSDPDKRAYYDRTGYESTAAAAAANAAARQGSGTAYQRGPGGMYYTQDFDPDEIFNMFFGGMGPGMTPGARVFRAQFGGHPQRRQHQPAAGGGGSGGDDMQRLLFSVMQFLPVLLLVIISMFAATQKAPFNLLRDHNHYPEEMKTMRLEVPFFVKSTLEFDRQYPKGSSGRYKVERQVESDYYERQQSRCHSERLTKQRMWAYGNKEEAGRMPMAACDEIDRMNQRLGLRNSYAW